MKDLLCLGFCGSFGCWFFSNSFFCWCFFEFVQINVGCVYYGGYVVQSCVGCQIIVESDCVGCVVVVWDDVVNVIWGVVGVDNSYNWDVQFVGFGNCQGFFFYVDYEQKIRSVVYFVDIVEGGLQFVLVMFYVQMFFFSQVFCVGCQFFVDFIEMFDGLGNGFLVGQCVVELMVVYVVLCGFFSSICDWVGGLMFGVYEKNVVVFCYCFMNSVQSCVQYRNGLGEVYDVDVIV